MLFMADKRCFRSRRRAWSTLQSFRVILEEGHKFDKGDTGTVVCLEFSKLLYRIPCSELFAFLSPTWRLRAGQTEASQWGFVELKSMVFNFQQRTELLLLTKCCAIFFWGGGWGRGLEPMWIWNKKLTKCCQRDRDISSVFRYIHDISWPHQTQPWLQALQLHFLRRFRSIDGGCPCTKCIEGSGG